MKSSRVWIVWLALGVCAVVVFGAMTWLTRNVLAAGRERAAAQHERALAEARADLEERTRLALWRMDALGAAIVLRENLHPADHYELLTKSPFLTATEPEVLLHFQIRQVGGLTSPELDALNAKEAGVDEKIIEERKERMIRLRALLAANPLPGDEWTQLNCAVVSGETSWNAVPKDAVPQQSANVFKRQTQDGQELRRDVAYQLNSNESEYAQRAKAVAKNIDNALADSAPRIEAQMKPGKAMAMDEPPAPAAEGTVIQVATVSDATPLRGVWLGGELFLLRQLRGGMRNPFGLGEREPVFNLTKSVQGVWMNAASLEKQLLDEVADLLPGADLVPALGKDLASNPMTLASFPFLLERHETAAAPAVPDKVGFGAPLRVGWVAVVLAVLATSLLVRGIMRLSERRASFVSAVTHELRTPLTTFRLYSDMLESGAVKEEKRGDYLRVLSREADRLSHLVENVLAFSRVERGNARSNLRVAAVDEMMEEMRERLEARLATAGLSLETHVSAGLRIKADTAAVEHILFNLIDNAAKYAATGDPATVIVETRRAGRNVEILVRDHGPGIPPSERARIFRAFHKSAREAAESQPGVGLGLALSRRLAREQGGELECADSKGGACFVLRLPGD